MHTRYLRVFLLLVISLGKALLPCPARSAEGPIAPATIYAISHGWHTGIILRYPDVPAHLWPERADFTGRIYLEVGWGDEAYYRAPKVNFGMALQAALSSEQSVLHVVGFDQAATEYFPDEDIVALHVSARGITDLVHFIHNSFRRAPGQRVTALGPGLYGESWFYPAMGRYSIFYNCNHWVADGLRRAGLPINVETAMTAGNVIDQARKVAERLR